MSELKATESMGENEPTVLTIGGVLYEGSHDSRDTATAECERETDEEEAEEDEEEIDESDDDGTSSTAFLEAAAGQWSKVRLRLFAGYDVNARCPTDPTKTVAENNMQRGKKPRVMCDTNCTLLHMAAGKGDLEAVCMLIDFGADVDAQDDRGATPLILATSKAWADVIEALLSSGANVGIVTYDGPVTYMYDDNNKNTSDYFGCDYPHPPPRHDDVEYENIAFYGREMCLHYAFNERVPTGAQCEAIVKMLLQYGADVNAQDGAGYTPLYRAIECRKTKLFEILLATSGINLDLMAKDVRFSSTGLLRRGTPLYGTSILFKKQAELLLAAGANPNVTDRAKRKSPFTIAVADGNLPFMRKLVAAGADVNWRNYEGMNALMIAASAAKIEVVEELLTTDLAPTMDINAVDDDGKTALIYAVESCDPQVVRRLIEAGANAHQHMYRSSEQAAGN